MVSVYFFTDITEQKQKNEKLDVASESKTARGTRSLPITRRLFLIGMVDLSINKSGIDVSFKEENSYLEDASLWKIWDVDWSEYIARLINAGLVIPAMQEVPKNDLLKI